MNARRSLFVLVATLATSAAAVRAEPTPDQLKASYDETVRQLQQSQDRKNQLAGENEQLKALVAELEGKLNAIDAQARQAEFLRGQYVAWSSFLERYPLMLKRFRALTRAETDSTAVTPPEPFFDPEWPFSAAGRVEEESAASRLKASEKPSESSSAPSTLPAMVQMFHGAPGHWCALCAAAAQRKAEAGAARVDLSSGPASTDLMQDLPPR